MSNANVDDIEKIDEYFKVIDDRIISTIQNTDVKKSCTATLALLFAAIDGLGQLSCKDEDYEKAGKRFKVFLKRMGQNYEGKSDIIWKIRNSLIHNGVNLESYMYATSEGDFAFEHLSTPGPNGFLYIDTTQFFSDFCQAKRQLREEINKSDEILKRAANRLDWLEADEKEYQESNNIARPSPPPPVEFIHMKK